jgi:hypothetical protein
MTNHAANYSQAWAVVAACAHRKRALRLGSIKPKAKRGYRFERTKRRADQRSVVLPTVVRLSLASARRFLQRARRVIRGSRMSGRRENPGHTWAGKAHPGFPTRPGCFRLAAKPAQLAVTTRPGCFSREFSVRVGGPSGVTLEGYARRQALKGSCFE